MVRECRPPAREPSRSWLARRSTMATSTPASANSPASIIPVGPPPAITTACSVIAALPSDTSRTTHAFRCSISVGSGLRRAIMRHDPGLHEGPVCGITWKWRGAGNRLSTSSAAAGRPHREAAACGVRRYRRPGRISDGLKPRTSASLGGRPRQTRPLRSGSSSSAVRPCFRSATSISPA
jgi:hypothetical protein